MEAKQQQQQQQKAEEKAALQKAVADAKQKSQGNLLVSDELATAQQKLKVWTEAEDSRAQ